MEKIVLTRRQVVKTLLAIGAGSSYVAYVHFFTGNTVSVSGIKKAEKVTPEIFSNLCSLVTLRDKHDPGMTAHMYKVFMDEPWGPDHILRIYNKISAALPAYAGKKKRPPLADPQWKLNAGEKWFVGHLLTTWYLGIYYHEQRATQLISSEKALMFDMTRGVIPVPFYEATGFGAWADPPDNKE
jgi:hypothetical protein